MKRTAQPTVSPEGQQAIDRYSDYLHYEQDLSTDTRRNYLSDLRQFAAWCEASWTEGQEAAHPFAPMAVVTPLITQYRAHLQTVCKLQPATINRHLVSLKRYFAWTAERGGIQRDPAKAVKLVPLVRQPPRHLTDQEENALIAAVSVHGTLRDRAVLILALHTGLRAEELCSLQRSNITLGKRSGHVASAGSVGRYSANTARAVPFSGTSRYLLRLP